VATVEVHTNDPAEIRAIRLALNRVAQEAKWDDARLKSEFQEFLDIGFDMSFAATTRLGGAANPIRHSGESLSCIEPHQHASPACCSCFCASECLGTG